MNGACANLLHRIPHGTIQHTRGSPRTQLNALRLMSNSKGELTVASPLNHCTYTRICMYLCTCLAGCQLPGCRAIIPPTHLNSTADVIASTPICLLRQVYFVCVLAVLKKKTLYHLGEKCNENRRHIYMYTRSMRWDILGVASPPCIYLRFDAVDYILAPHIQELNASVALIFGIGSRNFNSVFVQPSLQPVPIFPPLSQHILHVHQRTSL